MDELLQQIYETTMRRMISNPAPFVRRAGLIAWLESQGFTKGKVDEMIRTGLIPKKFFSATRKTLRVHSERQKKSRSSKHPTSAGSATSASAEGQQPNGYAWYKTAEVARILDISL